MHHDITTSPREFAAEVRRDLALAPKQLQSKYLYDALGSSLFEAICRLPWYRITRAGDRLLVRARGRDRRGARRDGQVTIVELGCGSGEKLVVLAEALQRRGGSRARAPDRHLVAGARADRAAADAPRSTSRSSATVDLRGGPAARRGARATATARCSCCCSARTSATSTRRPRASSCAGSAHALAPGDLLLLGADLVKPERDLLLAYDDPLGVTAAFNKNLLVRINRELGGHFDLAAFDHRAVWNRDRAAHRDAPRQPRRADRDHRGRQARPSRSLRRATSGRRARTSTEPDQIERMGGDTGFALRDQWIDEEARFALSLMIAV